MPRKTHRNKDLHHIEIRGDGQYRVKIRRHEHNISRPFSDLVSAQTWRDEQLIEIRRGTYRDTSRAQRTTWQALAKDYADTHDLNRTDRGDLRRLVESFGDKAVADITPTLLAGHIRRRGETVGPQQLRHEISLCGRVIRWSMRHRGMHLESGDPTQYVELPALPQGRERRLLVVGPAETDKEEYWIMRTAQRSRSQDLRDIIIIALETGMRCGELATIDRQSVDWHLSIVRLDRTKNGDRRDVPLSPTALSVLRERPAKLVPLSPEELERRGGQDDRIWNVTRPDSVSQAWQRLVPRARRAYAKHCETRGTAADGRMLTDLHFHDLRHEAAWRLAQIFQAADLAKIFGWRDLSMVLRYYQPTAEDHARRLAEAAK